MKRHNRFTHCPDTRRLARKSQGRACCWARRTAESASFSKEKKTRLDARRRKTNRSEAHRGLRKRARSSQPRPHSSSQRHIEHLPQMESRKKITRRERAQSLPAIAPQRARPRARRVRPAGAHKTATTKLLALSGSRLAPLLRTTLRRAPPSSRPFPRASESGLFLSAGPALKAAAAADGPHHTEAPSRRVVAASSRARSRSWRAKAEAARGGERTSRRATCSSCGHRR